MMLARNLILVGVGGMLGSMGRYLAAHFIRHGSFPYATFTVNVLGSFIIGVVMGFAARHEGFGNWRLFLATGICGGFTTFSAFAWENLQMLEQYRYGSFLVYVLGTLILGGLAVFLGYLVTKS